MYRALEAHWLHCVLPNEGIYLGPGEAPTARSVDMLHVSGRRPSRPAAVSATSTQRGPWSGGEATVLP